MIFERRGGMAVGGGKGMGFGIYLWLFLEDSVDSIFFKKIVIPIIISKFSAMQI